MVNNPLQMQETRVLSLGWGDPLEEEIATDSSILAWEIPRTEKPGGLQSMGSQESDMTERLNQPSICFCSVQAHQGQLRVALTTYSFGSLPHKNLHYLLTFLHKYLPFSSPLSAILNTPLYFSVIPRILNKIP